MVELIIYIGIASVIVVGLSVFISMTLRSRVRNAVQAEVETQGSQAFQIMTQVIRNGEDAEVVE